ncbi:MAG: hypothetical protein KIS66_07890 [Fimbriimonadaceae bacterium]|nr:hypothetical protein [Fimbriimonadaceae bacterium]
MLCALAALMSLAQPDFSTPPKGYVCYRASALLTIDGRLDEPPWDSAPWSDDFVDIEGDKKPKPRFRTRMKMLWDDKFLYIGAELEEPNVWATLTEHDSVIFQDNDFEVFLDPDGDNHRYTEFEMNALNTTWDLLLPRPYRDGGPAVDNWEMPGTRTAVHVMGSLNDPSDDDKGWNVEIAIPWSALEECAGVPCPPRHGDQWRINFSRVEWDVEVADGGTRKIPGRPEHNWVWSPQGVIDMHRPERWGYLQFSTAEPGSDAYRPDPAGPIRDRLHQAYYALHAYRGNHGRWPKSIDELDLGQLPHLVTRMSLYPGDETFEVVAETTLDPAKRVRWHIAQDSRVWRSERQADAP